jgi:hypothetical protein
MPADRLNLTHLETAVLSVLTGQPPGPVAARLGLRTAELTDAADTFHNAGRAALQHRADSRWQAYVEFPDWTTAEVTAASEVAAAEIVSRLDPLEADDHTADMRAAAGTVRGAEVWLTGQPAITSDLQPVYEEDLKVGELYIAVPIALLVLIFVFGTLAFLIPFLFALAAITDTSASGSSRRTSALRKRPPGPPPMHAMRTILTCRSGASRCPAPRPQHNIAEYGRPVNVQEQAPESPGNDPLSWRRQRPGRPRVPPVRRPRRSGGSRPRGAARSPAGT